MIGVYIVIGLTVLLIIVKDRSGMYVPRGWHFVGPVTVILVGFAIHEHYSRAWEVIMFINAPLAPIAWFWAKYIQEAGVVYQKYITRDGSPAKEDEQPKTEMSDGFVPLVRPIINANSQVVSLPKLDLERSFAIAVLRMHEFNPLKVNLTEEKWVKSGKFSREPFLVMLEKWKTHGIIDRKNGNKNSTYIVVKPEAVRLIAEGNPLPD